MLRSVALTLLQWISLPLPQSLPPTLLWRAETSHIESTTPILPASYPNITFCQARSAIEHYADASFDELLTTLNTSNGYFDHPSNTTAGYWVSQNAWTAITGRDRISGAQTYSSVVSENQETLATSSGPGNALWGVPLVNFFNDDAAWAALANIQAFEAYGDQIFHDRAVGVWQFITDHGFISQSVLDMGYLKGTKYPNTTLQSSCNGSSNLGGVYWMNGVPDTTISEAGAANTHVNAVSTGLYALLGAELCRLSGNMTYCDMSYASMQWIDRLLMTPNGLVNDNIDGKTCYPQFEDNAALYLATYAELGHITGNTTATRLAERTIVAAMTTAPWLTRQGKIDEGQGEPSKAADPIGFKAILIRYLQMVHPWISDDSIKAAIVRFINIQYWAMTNFASDSPSRPKDYGRNWTGPAYTLWTAHSQIASLDVLNALRLNADDAFPTRSVAKVSVATNATCGKQ